MIAVDTSVIISYMRGEEGSDIDILKSCILAENIILPPVVLSELLSDHRLPNYIKEVLVKLPLLEIKAGYWERVGLLRAKVLSRGLKARIADSLIAGCCIDNDVELITRDKDFIKFSQYCDLNIILKRDDSKS
jgi:predicted nucleic acid-binding protein